jgi:hypothetical protein
MGAKGDPKTGGRKKNTPNRVTLPLMERAAALKCDPFEILCRFAMGDWKKLGYEAETRTVFAPAGIEMEEPVIKPELRMQAAKEACQYLYPKRKAIEIEDKREKETQKFVVLWADDDTNGNASAQASNASAKADQ